MTVTKRLGLLAVGLVAAASFAVPSSASAASDAPCWAWGVWECLGSTGDTIKEILEVTS